MSKSVYLGRPYSQYARVVYKNSYLDSLIAAAGWKAWSTTDTRLGNQVFVEYNNTGPGNWENNAAARVAFGNATLATQDDYPLSTVMGGSTSWIDMTYWDSITLPAGLVTTSANTTTNTTTTTTTTTGNSTTPADGDYIVSQTAIGNLTVYSSISDAVAALPTSSSVTPTIFIYPGTYNERVVIQRSGTTIIQGYTSDPSDYTKNEVIITNAIGVDTSADQSNSDSATLYSRAKGLQMYNVNLKNTWNTEDYAALGMSVANNGYVAIYNSQIYGSQDTFNTNTGVNVFVYNSLITGTIDFSKSLQISSRILY